MVAVDESVPDVDLDDLLPHEVSLVLVIADQGDPVGARVALRALEEQGIDMSEASVSRMLARLDKLGLTRPVGRKGRTLTISGRAAVEARRLQVRRNRNFARALQLRSVTEVLDWLRARRAVEGEAAYLAAARIDENTLEELARAVAAHERAAPAGHLDFRSFGMDFHTTLARAAQSPVFTALVDSLVSHEAEAVESALDLITTSRGTIGHSASDHRALLEALKERDGERSRSIMEEHIARLEHEVEAFAEGTGDAAFASALDLLVRGQELRK